MDGWIFKFNTIRINIFKNITIKLKLILLLTLPLLGLISISAKAVYTDYLQAQKLEKLNIGIVLSGKISKLVHEIQKERGITAGYTSSKGIKFSNKLSAQRVLTNKRVDDLSTHIFH